MNVARAGHIIQVAFPQVYLACHTRHQRKRSTPLRLSARDSTILAHLDEQHGMRPTDLAEHLDLAASTVSEALKRLVALGYVEREPRAGRASPVRLSASGAKAISDTSVLETARLHVALNKLSARERNMIAKSFHLLAEACR